MWIFSDFQVGFRSSRSITDLLRVVSDRITRAFNGPGATWAEALDKSHAFDRVWLASLFYILKFYGITSQIFRLISSFFSNRQLQVVLDGKSSQEYPDNAVHEFLKASFLALHFSHYPLMTFLMMLYVTLVSMLMIFLSILSVIRHPVCDNN